MSHWLDVVREPNHRDIMRRQSLQDRPNTTQASSLSGTTTLGNCPCTIGVGVVDPTVSSLFVHKQPYRWKQPGVMAALNAKDGFALTSEPVAVWNTDSPSNSYISTDITRTVTVDEVEYTDTYVLTVTEDSSFGWKSNVSIKSGAAANCPDEIDWTWVCSTPMSPPTNTSTYMVLYGPETKKIEDNTDELTYLDPPGCGMCLVPAYTKNTFLCDVVGNSSYGLTLPSRIAIGSAFESPVNDWLGSPVYVGELFAMSAFPYDFGTDVFACRYTCGHGNFIGYPDYENCYYCPGSSQGVSIGAQITKATVGNVTLAMSMGTDIAGRQAHIYAAGTGSAPSGDWQAFATTVTNAQYDDMLDAGFAVLPFHSSSGDGGRCDDVILDSVTLYFL